MDSLYGLALHSEEDKRAHRERVRVAGKGQERRKDLRRRSDERHRASKPRGNRHAESTIHT